MHIETMSEFGPREGSLRLCHPGKDVDDTLAPVFLVHFSHIGKLSLV